MAASQTDPDEKDDQRVEIDGLWAKPRGYEFKVDVHDDNDERDPGLLIQAGRCGYQLDMWWGENNSYQCNNWVRFSEDAPGQYPHDNTHNRDPAIRAEKQDGEPTLIIHDPDPRAPTVGYEGADILVQRHEDGLYVELQWEDEWEDEQYYGVVVPFYDPRKSDDDREQYYEYMLPVVSTISE